MQKAEVVIDTEYISMDKLLKFSGIADTGGQAFMMVEDAFSSRVTAVVDVVKAFARSI